MSFTETIVLRPGAEKLSRSTQGGTPLGARAVLGERVFRWAHNASLALSVNRLIQESVVVSGHGDGLAVATTAAIGARAVTLTNSTTAITANQYAGGYLWVDNEGRAYKIKSHPAESTGSGSIVITLEDDDTLIVALTAGTSTCGLRVNQYEDVIVNPTTPTGVPVGVCLGAITADYYFWLQTWGPCPVLTNGTLLVGLTVTPGATTAGSVDVCPLNSVDASGQQPMVGVVSRFGATTEYSLIDLRIAP